MGEDVSLLGAYATGEAQAPVEQARVAAQVGGGDELLGPLGGGDDGAVVVIEVERVLAGVGAVVLPREGVADALDRRQPVGAAVVPAASLTVDQV